MHRTLKPKRSLSLACGRGKKPLQGPACVGGLKALQANDGDDDDGVAMTIHGEAGDRSLVRMLERPDCCCPYRNLRKF